MAPAWAASTRHHITLSYDILSYDDICQVVRIPDARRPLTAATCAADTSSQHRAPDCSPLAGAAPLKNVNILGARRRQPRRGVSCRLQRSGAARHGGALPRTPWAGTSTFPGDLRSGGWQAQAGTGRHRRTVMTRNGTSLSAPLVRRRGHRSGGRAPCTPPGLPLSTR